MKFADASGFEIVNMWGHNRNCIYIYENEIFICALVVITD